MNPDSASKALRHAEAALDFYPEWSLVRFVDIRENAIFEIESQDARRAVLRIHRPDYQTASAIRSELEWMRYLCASGMRVPEPILNRRDSPLTHTPSGATVSVLSWLPGTSLSEFRDGQFKDASELTRICRRLGCELARLHNLSDRFSKSAGFTRWSWDSLGFLGKTPHWGRFWEHPSLSTDQRRLMTKFRRAVRNKLQSWDAMGLEFGLIHADALPENVLVDGEDVYLIDFDDCGYGYRMYELAVAVWGLRSLPGHSALTAALHSGYCAARPLPDWQWKTLEGFIVVRNLLCLGWIADRAEIGDTDERFVKHTQWLESEGVRWLESNS